MRAPLRRRAHIGPGFHVALCNLNTRNSWDTGSRSLTKPEAFCSLHWSLKQGTPPSQQYWNHVPLPTQPKSLGDREVSHPDIFLSIRQPNPPFQHHRSPPNHPRSIRVQTRQPRQPRLHPLPDRDLHDSRVLDLHPDPQPRLRGGLDAVQPLRLPGPDPHALHQLRLPDRRGRPHLLRGLLDQLRLRPAVAGVRDHAKYQHDDAVAGQVHVPTDADNLAD